MNIDLDQSQYLEQFEQKVQYTLLQQLTNDGALDGELLAAEELDEKWEGAAPEYMAAAVPQIEQYPLVAIAWAGYVGIGAAVLWDLEWDSYKDCEDFYSLLAKPRGFDYMDEYVLEGLLGYKLEGEEAIRVENLLRSAAQTVQTMIRKEGVEPQSLLAFHIFARVTRAMYKVGVALGLRLMGYKYEKVHLEGN